MNTSTVATTSMATVTPYVPPPDFGEFLCEMIAENIKDTVVKYLSTVPAIPLHTVIVILLFLRVVKRRFYHLLIIVQSVTDIVALGAIFTTHSLCIVFKKLLTNWLTGKTAPVQLILNIFLVVYWKSAIRPQRLLDISFYVISALCLLLTIADQIFRADNRSPTPIAFVFLGCDILGNIGLTVVCFSTYFLVRRMNVSYFSEVTLKGQKKMTLALLLQFILILTTNITDILTSAMSYHALTDQTSFEFNLASQNVTDEAVLTQLKLEFMAQRSILYDITEQISVYTTFWNAFVPLLRGILICWAIRPLLQNKKTVIVVKQSTTELVS